MFQSTVLPLGVLPNDSKIDILVPRRNPGDGLAENDGRVDVELLAHCDVPGSVARAGDGGVEDS